MSSGNQPAPFFLFCFLGAASISVEAHEGHQPLPTRGVQVDAEKGKITLSKQARDSIGLDSEEVTLDQVSTSLNVFAEVVSPWHSTGFGSAQISGRIAKLLVRPGDRVERDQVVAELSSKELEQLREEFQQATREIELTQRLFSLTRPTAESGAVPMQRLLDLETANEQSQNRLEIIQMRAQSLGVNIDSLDMSGQAELFHQIRSPITGVVVHSDLAEGRFVEAFEHLFEIVNKDQHWVRFQILEKDLFKLSIDTPVSIEFNESAVVIDALIDRIDAGFDAKTKASWAWATIAHPDIVPGMVGKAEIKISTQDSQLTVPESAILSDGLQSYVFLEEASTRSAAEFKKKPIKLGNRRAVFDNPSESRIEVVQGDIYPGDRVVTKGSHQLSSLFFLGVLKLTDSDKKRLGIEVTPATVREVSETVDLPASVELPPWSISQLSSQLAGTIKSHSLFPGKKVRVGEHLVSIASPEFYRMQLDLISAVLEGQRLQRRAERLEQLSGDSVSTRTVVEIRSQAEQTHILSESLKRQLATLGLSDQEILLIVHERRILDSLPLRASISGNITVANLTLGETVSRSQSLAEIQNNDQFLIEARGPSATIGSIKLGTNGMAAFLTDPSVRIPVVGTRTAPIIDQVTRTQRLWLEPKPNDQFHTARSGMLMTVSISSAQPRSCLVVPLVAIVKDGSNNFVFVEKENGYIERRRVVVGIADSDFIEIEQGISPNESVVTLGSRELQTAHASLR